MKITMMASATIYSSLTHRLLGFAKVLVRRGHDVTIIAPRADKYSDFKPQMPAMVDGVRVVYPYQFATANPIINLIPYIISAIWKVWRTPADLVYIYKPTPLTVTGLIAKYLRSTPIILDMDDLGSEVMALEGQPGLMVKLVAWSERRAARAASSIIVASRLLEGEYRAKFPTKPVLRLSNGVNLTDFVSNPIKRPLRLVFFGALGRTNLLAPVLRALPAVLTAPGHETIMVDILGSGQASAELQNLADRLGLTDRVVFHGWTPLAEVNGYTQSGDIGLCIMPVERTTAAASNQKVFQYMAMGMCPVVSDTGDLSLYVAQGKAGAIVKAGDEADLAAILNRLIDRPVQRYSMARRALVMVKSDYTWDVLGEKLANFLEVQVATHETKAPKHKVLS